MEANAKLNQLLDSALLGWAEDKYDEVVPHLEAACKKAGLEVRYNVYNSGRQVSAVVYGIGRRAISVLFDQTKKKISKAQGAMGFGKSRMSSLAKAPTMTEVVEVPRVDKLFYVDTGLFRKKMVVEIDF